MGAVTTMENYSGEDDQLQNGVKHLHENGLTRLPRKYILPIQERPFTTPVADAERGVESGEPKVKLPVIDLAQLHGPCRAQAVEAIADACKDYGFFQVVNHGVPKEVVRGMMEVTRRFFESPFEERAKYMSANMFEPVRYGTSFNQSKDNFFSWRDFLKLTCHPMPDIVHRWPSSPADLRTVAATYVKETKHLFLALMEAILEGLQVTVSKKKKKMMTTKSTGQQHELEDDDEEHDDDVMKKFKDGSQLMVLNCFPPCPEPNLTLGMPPHSDYGFLTLLLQDRVQGLQIQLQERWVTIEPIDNGFVVNVGDHLEIFSNGKYKSVLHRVLVNSEKSRISVASLHSLPYDRIIRPSPELINDANPRRYMDTDFPTFLEYISSRDSEKKNFLETRKLS